MKSTNEIFSDNLKRLRKAAGITQEVLADRLGYSEKAISKWECGRSMPGADVLPKIAHLLGTNIDELFAVYTDEKYFLGIDGGGTKTAFLLCDREGNTISKVTLGGSNPIDVGVEKSFSVLDEGIRRLTQGFLPRSVYVHAGLACGTTSDLPKRIDEFLSHYRFAGHSNGSDAQNAVAAAFDREDGICIIVGTGSCGFCQIDGELRRVGGLGYLFDRAGSAYDIGCEALRASMMMEDGSGAPTMMREMILKCTGTSTVLENLRSFYTMGKTGVASFAPIVFDAWKSGDAIAEDILMRNMAHVALIAESLAKHFPDKQHINVKLTGGVAMNQPIIPLVEQALSDPKRFTVTLSENSNDLGAARLAMRLAKE